MEPSPVDLFIQRLQDLLADLILTGVNLCESSKWNELAPNGRQLGFVRLAEPISDLSAELTCRSNIQKWDVTRAVSNAKQLCLLCRIALE